MYKEEDKGGEALEQVAHRSHGCLVTGRLPD